MLRSEQIRSYFLKHPDKLEEIRKNLDIYSKNIFRDEAIPDFGQFLSHSKTIAQYFGHCVQNNLTPLSRKLHWYQKKKFIIPISIAFLLCFISFTPAGNALANSIYKTVIEWFDSEISIHHGNSNPSIDNELVSTYYDTIEDVRSILDIEIAHNSKKNNNEKVEVKKTEAFMQIKSAYSIDDHEIIITQTIYKGDTEWSTNIEYEEGQTINETVSNIQFVGYAHDKLGYAIAYINNISIEIYSQSISYIDFLRFIKEVVIE